MNKERAKELLPIIEAFVNGKVIEYLLDGEWRVATYPDWTPGVKYRIRQEPKLVPFTFEDRELFRGKWIRRKADGCEFCPNEIYLRSVYYQANNCVKYSDLLSKFEFLDGSPCGKYINE